MADDEPLLTSPVTHDVAVHVEDYARFVLDNDAIELTRENTSGILQKGGTILVLGDGDEVVKPADITMLDYEPELCYVVGKRAHGVKKADAMDYISGFTLMNDVSAREIQQREVALDVGRQLHVPHRRDHVPQALRRPGDQRGYVP